MASAPAVLAGTVAIALLTDLWPSGWLVALGPVPVAPFREATFGVDAFDIRPGLTSLLLWSFLCGGILDRYARNRPTRGRGFCAASGAHCAALARLGLIALGLFAVIYRMARATAPVPYAGAGLLLPALATSLLITVARVRLVVEDRRSAIGALLAGGRFVRRNAAAVIGVFLFYAVLGRGADWIGRGIQDLGWPAGITLVVSGAFAVLHCGLVLALYGSETSLFQSRLAHASYTAGPPLEWPESPAAEAIANLAPSGLP